MNRFANTALAACAALFLSLASIGAIATVPPAQVETPAAFVLPALA